MGIWDGVSETTLRLFRSLSRRYPTPARAQELLYEIPYNAEPHGETLRSALGAWEARTAHCLEGSFLTAAILEHQGHPPLIMSLESEDLLDHVLFLFRENDRWGAISTSRDVGLRGRAPIFRSLRALAWSYVDPYVDGSGRVTGYAVASLDDMRVRWRDGRANLWKAERYLIDLPHTPLRSSERRHARVLARYRRLGEHPTHESWW